MRHVVLMVLCGVLAACKTTPPHEPVKPEALSVKYRVATWRELPDWPGDELLTSWPAWLKSCSQISNRPEWKAVCNDAKTIVATNNDAVRGFFENRFAPWQVVSNTDAANAFITGYYDVLLTGGRTYKPGRVPLYGVPSDLLTINLGELYPELKGKRVRGRLQGRTVVPYWSRQDIDNGKANLANNILGWADDPLDAFFLHVQGSGRLQLEDGSLVRLGYADQNGQPYHSIGKWLVDHGELSLEQASMQSIRAWAKANPSRIQELLESDPSFIFFKASPGSTGAQGALNVPLTDGASIAIDPKFIPLGSPVYLTTTRPDDNRKLNRLVQAQDTGGAIRGPLRADYFWGSSPEAASLAGIMKQQGQLWLLWPLGFTPAVTQ